MTEFCTSAPEQPTKPREISHWEFENAEGQLPILTIGADLTRAEVVLIGILGIGVPSLKTPELDSYYLPAMKEITKENPEICGIVLLNWPGYGEEDLKADLRWKKEEIKPRSQEEKTAILKAITNRAAKEAKRAKTLVLAAHSTAGGIVLRNSELLLKIDPRLIMVAESPSGIGADQPSIRFFSGLAKFLPKLAEQIISSQEWSESSVIKNYGLSKPDSWALAVGPATPANVIRSEMAAEAAAEAGKKLAPYANNNHLLITVGEKDPMVNSVELRKLAEKWGIECHVFPSAGHLVLREPTGIAIWQRLINFHVMISCSK